MTTADLEYYVRVQDAQVKRLEGEIATLNKQLATVGPTAAKSGATADAAFSKMNKSVASAGTKMRRNFTVPIVAAGAVATKMFLDFEDQMTKVQALTGATAQQTEQWGKGIKEMAKGLPQGPQELASALYFVASSGISANKVLEVTEASAKGAAAGLGDTAEVADAVTSAINAYGEGNLKASRATDVLVSSVKFGKAEASDFSRVIGNVIPLASKLGVEFDEVGAALAAQTLQGTSARFAAMRFRAVLATFLKPTKATREELKKMGTSAEGVRKSFAEKGVIATLTAFSKELGNNKEAMARLFPNQAALIAYLQLTGKNAEQVKKIFAGVQRRGRRDRQGVRDRLAIDAVQVQGGVVAGTCRGHRLRRSHPPGRHRRRRRDQQADRLVQQHVGLGQAGLRVRRPRRGCHRPPPDRVQQGRRAGRTRAQAVAGLRVLTAALLVGVKVAEDAPPSQPSARAPSCRPRPSPPAPSSSPPPASERHRRDHRRARHHRGPLGPRHRRVRIGHAQAVGALHEHLEEHRGRCRVVLPADRARVDQGGPRPARRLRVRRLGVRSGKKIQKGLQDPLDNLEDWVRKEFAPNFVSLMGSRPGRRGRARKQAVIGSGRTSCMSILENVTLIANYSIAKIKGIVAAAGFTESIISDGKVKVEKLKADYDAYYKALKDSQSIQPPEISFGGGGGGGDVGGGGTGGGWTKTGPVEGGAAARHHHELPGESCRVAYG